MLLYISLHLKQKFSPAFEEIIQSGREGKKEKWGKGERHGERLKMAELY